MEKERLDTLNVKEQELFNGLIGDVAYLLNQVTLSLEEYTGMRSAFFGTQDFWEQLREHLAPAIEYLKICEETAAINNTPVPTE